MTDMAGYMETGRRTLDDMGRRVSRPKNKSIDFKFGQENDQGRELVNMLGDKATKRASL